MVSYAGSLIIAANMPLRQFVPVISKGKPTLPSSKIHAAMMLKTAQVLWMTTPDHPEELVPRFRQSSRVFSLLEYPLSTLDSALVYSKPRPIPTAPFGQAQLVYVIVCVQVHILLRGARGHICYSHYT